MSGVETRAELIDVKLKTFGWASVEGSKKKIYDLEKLKKSILQMVFTKKLRKW